MEQIGRPNRVFTGALAMLLLGVVLYVAQTVILPVVLAAFLAVLINPILQRLHKYLPSWLSLGLVLLALAIALIGGTTLFATTLYQVGLEIPVYVARFETEFQGLVDWGAKYGVDLSWEQVGTKESLSYLLQFVGSGLGSVATVVGQLVIILFIMVFMVFEARQFGRKVDAAFSSGVSEQVRESALAIIDQIQRYIVTKMFISLLSGFCMFVICLAFQVDFAFFWGALAFALNFVPNIGSIIAILPPSLIAFLQHHSAGWAAALLAVLVTVQLIIGNVLEPKVMSRSMSLSTLVVFLSMIFWGWLWGIVGVVLSVPLTVAAKIICQHVPGLEPVAILLGEEPPSPSTARSAL
ncbi:MAG: hypothetical protein CO108_20870 [Deltaproteobacteria bacterium CG_4_9_14_3_um_filter_63_12]|nr:MAG: hypothetical protein COW42_11475 [Deltaproteobacteria bacterium CG17_big_fil_post_rev_8_21_14_2_50_63_7]PJB37570.1 MAG: hypothetical protein CO108_20870 [Deltaproteobacteria bacterium CG_4_9_14_3_um_filter_63_12]